jgi:hypothetical protein
MSATPDEHSFGKAAAETKEKKKNRGHAAL